ncbi:siderophore-interacting protein [Streptomyces sp. NPDC006678]|uniref:siderophore-interacting protein n=2 Tax=unclassified Streptomyces TaxID=2593676 RepID=UPI003406D032
MEHTLPVRFVQVTGVRRLTPRMARITFGGPDLAGFDLAGPDQQVKLYFPRPGQRVSLLPASGAGADGDVMRWYAAYSEIPDAERPWMRSYTVRACDTGRGTIDIDFCLHEDAGPATRWAAAARPGDTLGMFGPSAWFSRPIGLGTAEWVLLAGDDAALPAIATILEWLPPGIHALVFAEVADAAEEQTFATRAEATLHWLHRGMRRAGTGGLLTQAVRTADLPRGLLYAWLGGEAGTVRALRRHLVDERGVDRLSVDFTGYWRLHLSQDDAPTEEDLTEARERLAEAEER